MVIIQGTCRAKNYCTDGNKFLQMPQNGAKKVRQPDGLPDNICKSNFTGLIQIVHGVYYLKQNLNGI